MGETANKLPLLYHSIQSFNTDVLGARYPNNFLRSAPKDRRPRSVLTHFVKLFALWCYTTLCGRHTVALNLCSILH